MDFIDKNDMKMPQLQLVVGTVKDDQDSISELPDQAKTKTLDATSWTSLPQSQSPHAKEKTISNSNPTVQETSTFEDDKDNTPSTSTESNLIDEMKETKRDYFCCSNCSAKVMHNEFRNMRGFITCSVFDFERRKLVKMNVKLIEAMTKLFLPRGLNVADSSSMLNYNLCNDCVSRLSQLFSLYNEYISLSALSNSALAKFMSRSCDRNLFFEANCNSEEPPKLSFSTSKRAFNVKSLTSKRKKITQRRPNHDGTKFRHSTIEREAGSVRIQSNLNNGGTDEKVQSRLRLSPSLRVLEVSSSNSNDEFECVRKSRSNREITCDRCSKAFKSLIGLKIHYASHLRDDNKLKCKECGKKFQKEDALTMHSRIEHEGFKPHKCPHEGCNKSFRLKDKLKLHIKTVHERKKPFACLKCEKSFRTKYHLKVHDVSQHIQGDKSVGCSKCKRKFTSEELLIAHLKSHEEDKSFICSFCKKGFQTATRLRLHRKSHDVIPSCICSVCGKAYKHARDLRLHEVIHQDESTYRFACGDCPKKFYRIDLLRVHQSNTRHFSPELIGPSISKNETAISSNKSKLTKQKRENRDEICDEELIFHEIESGPDSTESNKRSKTVPKLKIRRSKLPFSPNKQTRNAKANKQDSKSFYKPSSLYQPNLPSLACDETTIGIANKVIDNHQERASFDKGKAVSVTNLLEESSDDTGLILSNSLSSPNSNIFGNNIQRGALFPLKEPSSIDRSLPSFIVAMGAEQIGFDVISEFVNNLNSEEI